MLYNVEAMQYEISAGGVIIANKNSELQVLLLKDKGGKWTFPKGLIEAGEEKEATAEREIGEEVGIKNLKLLTSLSPVEYFYRWEGNLKKKTVHYFLFEGDCSEKPRPQREEGIMDVQWFLWEEATRIIGYKKTNKHILEEAKEKLLSS